LRFSGRYIKNTVLLGCDVSEESAAASSYHEDVGRMFHRKVGKFRPACTTSHPIRQFNSTPLMITSQLKFSGNVSVEDTWLKVVHVNEIWMFSRRCCRRLKSYGM